MLTHPSSTRPRAAVVALPAGASRPHPAAVAVAGIVLGLAAAPGHAQDSGAPIESIQVSGSWLGSGLQNSVKNFAGARTVVDKEDIDDSGALDIGDVLRRVPGVQATDNSGTAGSAISLNIGVRGLTGRYSPRSTILLDGIPLAVAPYGQPHLSFAPVSLNNIEAIDVVRGGGAVRYGPQNVGGIINFRSRAIPEGAIGGDVSVRYNDFSETGHNRQYSAFIGGTLDNGLGLALMYSGMDGGGWRVGSDDKVNDVALKFRYALGAHSEVYGKLSYFDVNSRTPGGLTVAQYDANPFQNTRPTDFWSGERKGGDVGYLNTISATQEVEVKAYYNESFRQSALINASRTQITWQPRNYQVLGIEPRYTQRFATGGAVTHDVTLGYRFLRERGDDNNYAQNVASGVRGAANTFLNATDAHAFYIDDRIALGAWRITPGLRYERIESDRRDAASSAAFASKNDKPLPSLNVAYLVNRALTVFANYTTSFGAVQNTQLNSQSASNPLNPEVAKTAELGARWKDRAVSAELTAFTLKFDNQIIQVPGISPATFQNIGATRHEGIETAVDYTFDDGGPLAGLNLYANYTYTKAIQQSGATAGLDVPFYSRNTDTLGARYRSGAWSAHLSSTHQTRQFSDAANTVAEAANGGVGAVPGFRLWNAQLGWKLKGRPGYEVLAGVNNLADKRYYTRNVDGNAGRMVGAPRTAYLQLRAAY